MHSLGNALSVTGQTAKQLLAETNHPISMISELVGFNDAERMAVVFKRITGNAPSFFRKILRNQ